MLLRALWMAPPMRVGRTTKTCLPVRQALRTMKITVILAMVACTQVSAEGLAQINISAKKTPLQKVLKELEQQSGFDFLYDATLVQKAGTVNAELRNVSLQKALEQCLKEKALGFTIVGKTVVIKPLEELVLLAPPPQGLEVRGRVVGEDGVPLPSITVTIKGTRNATATDNNGVFILKEVDAAAALLITSVNYETSEVGVNGRSDLGQIRLKVKVNQLQEVNVTVSTGYQNISKERSAGAFGKPDEQILKDRSSSMNILQRLDGLVAGLTVNNSPSASQNPLLIRGLSTIGISDGFNTYTGTNRNPLFVVDGIALDNVASINPQDVDDVTVLKDATAASIWGARASNGVIIITTKKAAANEKLRVQYDGFINLQGKPELDYFPVLGSRQFIQAARDVFDPVSYPWNTASAYQNLGSVGVPPHEMILYNRYRGLISTDQANSSLDSLGSISNVQQIGETWFRNAALMNHTLSVSGGGKLHAVYGSLSFTDAQSSTPGEENQTYKINVRQDFNFNKHFQAYLITDLTNTVNSGRQSIAIDNRFYPYQLFKDENNNNLSMPYMGYLSDSIRVAFQNRSRIDLDYNPLNEFEEGRNKTNAMLNRIISGITLRLAKGLRFEGVYGYIRGGSRSTADLSLASYPVRTELVQFTVAATPAATPVYYLPVNGGRHSVTTVDQRNWTVRNQLIYDNAWNNREHQLIVMAGQEAQEQFSITNRSTVRGYNEDLQTFGAVDYATLGTTGVAAPVMPNNIGRSILSNDVFGQSELQTRFTSYYANAAYTYNMKYTLNGSWRIDQSNLFGVDKSAQNRPVWSVGAKWNMGKEKFAGNLEWMKRMALRATYGITGNSPAPGTASSWDVLVSQSSNFLPGGVGLRIGTPGNAKLTWESTETINLGLDFSLLANRVSGSLDFYRKKTNDLIGDLAVNNFTGYTAVVGNFGNMLNKGFELTLNSLNIRKRDFSWNTILTLAYNKNTVTQLNTVVPIITGNQMVAQRFMTGYPAFAVFAYQYAGLDTLGDPMIQLHDKTVSKARNITKPEDVAFMGTYQPVWSGGLSNVFVYKNLRLAVNAVYNLGHVMRRDVNTYFTGRLMHQALNFSTGNVHAEFDDRWRQRGDEASIQVPSYVSNASLSTNRRDVTYYTRADVNVVDASYLKLRDITLAYTLPRNLLNKMRTDNITFRVQVSNLMLWKANKFGIDPEFHEAFFGTRSIRSNQASIAFGANIVL